MADADEGFVRGQAYHIKPLRIVAGREQTYGVGGGGGYIGNGSGWGLQEGPHRGEGGEGTIREIALPSVMAEFMNDAIYSQSLIDNEYNARFSTLFTDAERELEERKSAEKARQTLSPQAAAEVDQKVARDLIEEKKFRYISTAPTIYDLYGQSPFFLMEVLPRQKMREFLNSGSADPDALRALYSMFDNVYKSALELKALSLSVDVIAGKLSDLARQRNKLESAVNLDDVSWAALNDQRLNIIALERDIHAQQLPEFLQTELITASGSLEGMMRTQALTHYRAMLQSLAAMKIQQIQPVVAPPPYKSGGVTINFPAANPKISAPLSKPELEALNELVYLQLNTPVGVKWLSYHDALLKAESARKLTATADAFGELAERADEAEQIKSAIKFTADFYKEVAEKFGEKSSVLAKDLAASAKGKAIRNAEQAIKAFDQYQGNLAKKFSAQDREAIAKALDALDKDMMAKTLDRFGKGLGLVSNAMDFADLASEAKKSSESGDWRPFFVKAETILAGRAASALIAFMFGLTVATPLGILGFALLMALTSALIDDALVNNVNGYILDL